MALRRFIADRGHPTTIYSDNGTNLVVGEKELSEGIVNLNSKLMTEEMIDQGINLKFSPPSGPHFGGSLECLVGSSKKSLCAVLEERSVNDEVLLTVLKEFESLLNSRPLTHVSTEPEPVNAKSLYSWLPPPSLSTGSRRSVLWFDQATLQAVAIHCKSVLAQMDA